MVKEPNRIQCRPDCICRISNLVSMNESLADTNFISLALRPLRPIMPLSIDQTVSPLSAGR